MNANTKLSKFQKNELYDLREEFPEMLVVTNAFDTVIVYRKAGNVVEFATAVMAEGEKKFRRKVGEFIARTRLADGQCAIMSLDNFEHLVCNLGFE